MSQHQSAAIPATKNQQKRQYTRKKTAQQKQEQTTTQQQVPPQSHSLFLQHDVSSGSNNCLHLPIQTQDVSLGISSAVHLAGTCSNSSQKEPHAFEEPHADSFLFVHSEKTVGDFIEATRQSYATIENHTFHLPTKYSSPHDLPDKLDNTARPSPSFFTYPRQENARHIDPSLDLPHPSSSSSSNNTIPSPSASTPTTTTPTMAAYHHLNNNISASASSSTAAAAASNNSPTRSPFSHRLSRQQQVHSMAMASAVATPGPSTTPGNPYNFSTGGGFGPGSASGAAGGNMGGGSGASASRVIPSVVACQTELTTGPQMNGIPPSTDICCFWDSHPFVGQPVGLPIELRNNVAIVTGVFCSTECAAAWNFADPTSSKDQQWERYTLLNLVYRPISSSTSMPGLSKCGNMTMSLLARQSIRVALPRYTLSIFGGPLSIHEFRHLSKQDKYSVYLPYYPLSFVTPTQEITPIDIGFNSSAEDLPNRDKPPGTLRLFRKKPRYADTGLRDCVTRTNKPPPSSSTSSSTFMVS